MCVACFRSVVTIKQEWHSAKCGGCMYVSQKGNMCCEHHLRGRACVHGRMCDFRFDCGMRGPESVHTFANPYMKADRQSFSHAMGSAMAMQYLGAAELSWVQELLSSMNAQFPL